MSIQRSKLNKWLPRFLLLVIPLYIINCSFTKILQCPSCYLFEDSGDGLKNYYSLSWYVLHDEGLHFSGMNAPYGDHILFSDNQPILAVFLRFIHNNITDLSGHTIGIVNMLLIFSLLFTVFILYLLFRQLAINRFAATAFAIIITFLSPQISRYTGHYSLAYTFIIPLFFYFLVRFQKSKANYRWALAMIAVVIVSGLLHLYHFLMLSAFIGFFTLIQGVKYWRFGKLDWTIQKIRSKFIWLAAICIVPTVFLLGGMSLTDQIDDRPTTPYRAHGLNAKFNSTFIPVYGPFGEYWQKTFGTKVPHTESWSYVSFIGLLLLPAAMYFLLRRRKRSSFSDARNVDWMHSTLLAALFVWILAAGILYSSIFSWLLELVPKLKQFRGLARLSWVFYYGYTIFIAYYLTRLARHLKFKRFRALGVYTLIAAICVMGLEAYLHARPIFRQIKKDNNYLNVKKSFFTEELHKHGFKATDFQSILMLPLISLGSENLGIARGNWTMRRGIQAAHELGIPLIDYSLSRTSVGQTLDFIQLLSSDAVEKKRLKRMDDAPILLVAEVGLLTEAENRLLKKATLIGETQQVKLFSLLPSDFDYNPEKWNLIPDSTEYIEPIFFDDFESDIFENSLIGEGVRFVHERKEQISSYTSTLDSSAKAKIHLWFYIDNREASMSVLRVREKDPSGKIISDIGIHRDDVDWSEVVGPWIRLDRDITIKSKGYTYDFFIDVSSTIVDALQIRNAKGASLVKMKDGRPVFLNGKLIPQK